MKLISFSLVAAAFFATAIGGAGAATATRTAVQRVAEPPTFTVTVASSRIAALREEVWSCQGRAGLALSKAAQDPRSLASASSGYRAWVAGLWHHRLGYCRTVLAHTLPDTNDWQTAVSVVQRVYPGSGPWMLSCSGSEGGHGIFVYHGGGTTYPGYDTPGGWMQYFESTFWGDFDAAVQDLRARHVRVPLSAFNWHSPLGQALAAGWAHNDGHYTGGKWTGSGCW